MQRGGKFLGAVTMLSVAACGGEQGKLQIRPIGAPLAAGYKAVPFRIAEAHGQFALGNIGLALEAFRKALREDPNSIDAMTGVAACYDRMARFDLSRRHYEAALAIAPGDPQLLTAFAASLDLQGRATEAASVRQEVKQRTASASHDSVPQRAAAVIAHPGVTVALQPTAVVARPSPAKPVQTAQAVPATVAPVPLGHAQVAQTKVAPLATPPMPVAAPMPAVPPTPVAAPRPVIASPAVGRSVTVALPAARPLPVPPAARLAVENAATVALPPVKQLPVTPPTPAAAESAVIMARTERDAAKDRGRMPTGPRLERTSLREVALITVPGPQWRALTVSRTQRSATVRFVPLRQAAAAPAGVRLLNAARSHRLAARTRIYLAGRGWRAISIGDAPATRMRSVILYPANRRRTAERLSAQFGFAIMQRPGARQVTILLGRDAARDTALRARS